MEKRTTIGAVSDKSQGKPQCGKRCGRRHAKPDSSAGRGSEKNRGWNGKGRVFHRKWKRNMSVHCAISEPVRAPSFFFWYMAEDRVELDKYVYFDEPSDHVVQVHREHLVKPYEDQTSGTTCGCDERQERDVHEATSHTIPSAMGIRGICG